MELKKSKKADLEWRKSMFFQIGVFVSLILVLAMFELFGSREKELVAFDYTGAAEIEDIILPTAPPKDVPPPPPAPMTTTVIEIMKGNDPIETNVEIDVESNESTVTHEIKYVGFEPEAPVVEDPIFRVVEENPEFPGGEDARIKFLQENTNYPRIARDAGIEGKVIVGFVVEKDGSISNVEIIRGRVQSLDEEALRVVKIMPKWKPGKQRNRAVRAHFRMPVVFMLQ